MNKYFLEIKNRSVIILFNWIITFIVLYVHKEKALFLILKPSLYISDVKPFIYFIFTNVTELFSVYLTLLFWMSSIILIVFSAYHLVNFLIPALYFFEYNFVTNLFFLSTMLLIVSTIFFVKYIFPFFFLFFLGFQDPAQNSRIAVFFFESKINEYLSFFLITYKSCILNFQFFLIVLVFLFHIKINLKAIRMLRKVIYLFFIIAATLLTPPDIFSQLFVFSLLMLFFETFIFYSICKLILIR